jgi:hypothetical protein
MAENIHFILDYETLGQDVFSAPVVNCSYYKFDWDRFTSDNPYTFNELIKEIQFDKMNVEEQVKQGYKIERDSLDWWKDQGEEALKQIKPSDQDISVHQFVQNLYDYLKNTKVSYWWSRSNTFDPILLHRNFRDHMSREMLDFVLPYWLVRDTRTYIDTNFQFKLKPKENGFIPIDDHDLWNKHFIKHNSIHDVAADILRLQKIERSIHL